MDDNQNLELDQYLFFWVGQISAFFSRGVTKALRPYGVNLTTWRVLALLEQRGVMTISEVHDYSGIERSTVSRTVDEMEKQGLIVRLAREEDKRMTDMRITPAGSELYAKILPAVSRWNQRNLHDLSTEEIQMAIRVLKKVRANFSADQQFTVDAM